MNAKNKIKYRINFYKQTINTQKYILIFVLSIALAFYATIQIAFGYNYTIGFIRTISFGVYIICLFLILLINTKNVFDIYEKNYNIIIRFKTKKEFISELIKTVCICNLFTLVLNIALLMIGLNIFNQNGINPKYEIFSLPSKWYLIFLIIKLIILSQILTFYNIILLKIINNKIVIIGNIILYTLISGASKQYHIITNIRQMPIFIGDYLNINLYNSFLFELLCFALYVTIMLTIGIILEKFTVKKMRDIG